MAMTNAEKSLRLELDNQSVTGKAWAMVMAQCSHESAHFTRLIESFAYEDALHLSKTFPKHIKNEADARSLINAGHAAIANRVYGGRMGNGDIASNDGWMYRGRGLIQITGRANYKKYSELSGEDLISYPDRACTPTIAAYIAYLYFKHTPGLMDYANKGDVAHCTLLINGGTLGLTSRNNEYAKFYSGLQD